MWLTIIRMLAFALSNVGWWELLRRKTKLNPYFWPGLTIAIQTTILFVAGLLNVLLEASFLVAALGWGYLVYSVVRDRGILFVRQYAKIGYLFLAVSSIVVLITVNGKLFGHYDNFSHWALVVKTMLETNRFPNFEDTIIAFQEYPLGSSSYIYFFARMVGNSESVQMFAQAYIMLASMMPLFAFCKKNRAAAGIVMLAAANVFLIYNIPVTELLVDTLLPLVGMSSFVYAYFYCGKIVGKFEFFAVGFYMVQLLQIKNSGIFFVAFLVLWILFQGRKDKKFGMRIACAGLPFLSLLLWQRHCAYVFAESSTSKHAMTVENYQAVFGEKTAEDIRQIGLAVLRHSLTFKDVWATFFVLLVVGIFIWLFLPAEKRAFKRVAGVAVVLYVVYQLGLLGMYIFSMEGSEAARLAGIFRYTKTILIAVMYLAMVMVMRVLSDVGPRSGSSLGASLAVAAGVVLLFCGYMQFCMGSVKLVVQYPGSDSEHTWFEEVKQKYDLPEEESYCIVVGEDDSADYLAYMAKYVFYSLDVHCVQQKDLEALETDNSQYIILYAQDSEELQVWLQQNYPEQVGNTIIVRENA